MALNKAIVPYYYEKLKNGFLTVEKIKKYSLTSLGFIGLPALICYFLPNSWFTWFLGVQFSEAQFYTVLFLIGYGLTLPYLILVNFFFFYGKNKLIATITFLTSIVYIILLAGLSEISIQVIPFSLILSNLLMVVVLWIVIGCKKKF
jgi:O-antigen/teichoic acid export membrane protein